MRVVSISPSLQRFLMLAALMTLVVPTVHAQKRRYSTVPTKAKSAAPMPKAKAAGPMVADDTVPAEDVPLVPLTLSDRVLERTVSFSRSAQPHGIYFESLDGESVLNQNADTPYNPASVTKVMTTMAALETFGPDYRYTTRVGYTGTIDRERGVLVGDLFIDGELDPSFNNESAFLLGEKIREAGITAVEGGLRVGPGFTLNLSSSQAGKAMLTLIDRARWSKTTERSWEFFRKVMPNPSVEYLGVRITNDTILAPTFEDHPTPLLEYKSAPLVSIVKVMNAYSNNHMAHMIGARVGGGAGVQRYLVDKVKIKAGEVYLETTSGLGHNSITPRATVQLMKYTVNFCDKHRIDISDLMPVGGVDVGTLSGRFSRQELVGSVVAKTGTLSNVSALAGVLYTKNRGPVAFAILERGGPHALRRLQEDIIALVAEECGGAEGVAFGSAMSPSLTPEARVNFAANRSAQR